MTAKILPFPGDVSDADLDAFLAELPEPDYSLHLRPGETLQDRIPEKLARGRAHAAERRRAAFRCV